MFWVASDQLVSTKPWFPLHHVTLYISYYVQVTGQNLWTQRYLYADSASAGYAVGAEVKPSIPGQKQVKYGAKCGDHFWLLCKPA